MIALSKKIPSSRSTSRRTGRGSLLKCIGNGARRGFFVSAVPQRSSSSSSSSLSGLSSSRVSPACPSRILCSVGHSRKSHAIFGGSQRLFSCRISLSQTAFSQSIRGHKMNRINQKNHSHLQRRMDHTGFQTRPQMADFKPSATLQINETSKQLEAQGKTIYKFGLGQSPFPVPPEVVKALSENASEKDYLNVFGETTLRETVADYYYHKYNINTNADLVMIGPGSKELMFLMQWVYHGNTILPSPSWVSYAPQAKLATKNIQWIEMAPSRKRLLDPEMLDKHLESVKKENNESGQMLFLNYPSNPLGSTFTRDELQDIAAVARKHKLAVLSDEIYGEIHHEGKHSSIFEFYPERTIISSGLSKWCGAGGWRLGTFVFPEELYWLRDTMGVMASETFSAVAAPIQYAAITAFQQPPSVILYLEKSRHILKSLARVLSERLNQTKIQFPEPEGGFYLYLDFAEYADNLRRRGITDAREFCSRLLVETGVAVLPSQEFGRPEGEFAIRLSYVNFNGGKALDYLDSHPELMQAPIPREELEKIAPNTLKALDLLIDFTERQ